MITKAIHFFYHIEHSSLRNTQVLPLTHPCALNALVFPFYIIDSTEEDIIHFSTLKTLNKKYSAGKINRIPTINAINNTFMTVCSAEASWIDNIPPP